MTTHRLDETRMPDEATDMFELAARHDGAAGSNDQFSTGEGFELSNHDLDGDPRTVSGPGGSTYLVYDEAGRVTSSSGATGATYRYDGDGRRVERAAGRQTTRFLYDGDALVAELSGANAVTLYRAPAGAGFVQGGQQRVEHESALGSTLTVRDGVGGTLGVTEYDAYGSEVYAGVNADRGDLRFAGAKGYVNDDASGMQMLGARYYVPRLGRFLTQDPIGQEGGLNLYAYCSDSPLLRADPKGTYEVWLAWHHVALDTFHSFVMVRDNVKGSSTYDWTWGFSAGPSRYGPSSLLDAGPIVDHSGLYNRSHYDNLYYWQIGKTQLDSNGLAVAPLLNYLSSKRGEIMALKPQVQAA